MFAAILLSTMTAGQTPEFFAPGGCHGRVVGTLALVPVERTHLKLVRVHAASGGCSGTPAKASMPVPMPGPGPTTTPVPIPAPKSAPTPVAVVTAPAPVAAALSVPRRILGGVRAAVCGNGACGR